MRLLILGGYRFVGRAVIDAALREGHSVTAFNRGGHVDAALPVEWVSGDRMSDLHKLKGREWDALIDTCAFTPKTVEHSARALGESVKQYVFISTLSVYGWPVTPGVDENSDFISSSPGSDLEDATVMDTYPARKGACEKQLAEMLDKKLCVIRPGFVVGPFDYTDRLTYWIDRALEGTDFVAPGESARFVQLIDVDDLADFILKCVASRIMGTFNASAPAQSLTFGDMIAQCIDVAGAGGSPVWVPDNILLEAGFEYGVDFPYWVAAEENGIMLVNTEKAALHGLCCSPFRETVAKTTDWVRSRGQARDYKRDVFREKKAIATYMSTEVG